MRKSYSGSFKAKVAIDVIKEHETVTELASKYQVHRALLTRWKKEAIEGLPGVFSQTNKNNKDHEKLIEELYKQIGQLTVENEWLKKKRLIQSIPERRHLVDKEHDNISINRQCQLLEVSKGALYYKPKLRDPKDLELMDMIDEQHTKTPFYGSRRFTNFLRQKGYIVNRKRVQKLMNEMGIEAIYPKPKFNRRNEDHRIYPYLLRGLKIQKPDCVWSTDITYIRIGKGFGYLTSVIDWHSRYVLSWKLSNSLDNSFCIAALEEALDISEPEFFNTDQGCQYTAQNFLKPLIERGIKISMNSKGRALDNIYVERLWRTVKYEEIYIKDYTNMKDAYSSLKMYFKFYNQERPHQSLNYKTPEYVYLST